MTIPRTPITGDLNSVAAAGTNHHLSQPIALVDSNDIPSTSAWPNHVVVVPAHISEQDGPVYAVLESMGTQRGKSSARRSSSSIGIWIAREIVNGIRTENTFIIPTHKVVFANKEAYDLDAHGYLCRTGMVVLKDKLLCVQVQKFKICNGILTLTVQCRGEDPIPSPWDISAKELHRSTLEEFIVGFGHTLSSKRLKAWSSWSCFFANHLSNAECLEDLMKNASVPRPKYNDSEMLVLTDPDEVDYEINVADYMNQNVFNHEPEQLDQPDSEIQPMFDNMALDDKLPPVSRSIFDNHHQPPIPTPTVAQDLTSRFNASHASTPINDPIGFGHRPGPGPAFGPGLGPGPGRAVASSIDTSHATGYKKHGLQMNSYQAERHMALFKDELLNGRWLHDGIETRAEYVMECELGRCEYEVNRATVLQILFGTIGSTPLAYYFPTAKIPNRLEQIIISGKWTTVATPSQWISSIKELIDAMKVVTRIVNLYYKPVIAQAFMIVYDEAQSKGDLEMDQEGVNMYRDYFQRVMGTISRNATIAGMGNDELIRLTKMELLPTSEIYTQVIGVRMNLRAAEVLFGSKQPKLPTAKTADKPTEGKKKPMSEAQRALVPRIDGSPICLAYTTQKGCNTKNCPLPHSTMDLPEGIRGWVRRNHGIPKRA